MCKDWPPLLNYLHDKFGFKVQRGQVTLGYQLFHVDLSSWKLSLSEHTTVIWAKSGDVADRSPRHLWESLQDVIAQRRLRRRIVIVLLDGDGAALREEINSSHNHVAIIDAAAQERARQSRRPSGELLDLISAQIPLATLAPYETRSPVSGSRFFGRNYEISKILASPDTNYVILGVRRIGKTSLLHEIWRQLQEEEELAGVAADGDSPDGRPTVYLDCSNLATIDDFVREAVRRLNPKELPRLHMQEYAFYFPDFLERMRRKYGSRVVFLLDEIDYLLAQQRGSWEFLRVLRASANKKACQYVMAGFREAQKELNDLNSPFFNFGEPICLSEFTRRQAHELIVTPMENLRVHFRNREEVVARIYGETAGQPNLIQYYCQILLRGLDESGQREISPDNLIDVYNDEGFSSHLVNSFLQNTHNREKALVYAVLGKIGERRTAAFSEEDMDNALQERGIVLTHNQLNEACEVLKLAGVLHQKERDYSFTSPVFTRVLERSHDVGYLFRKVKEEGI